MPHPIESGITYNCQHSGFLNARLGRKAKTAPIIGKIDAIITAFNFKLGDVVATPL